jgi:hypothetical protein
VMLVTYEEGGLSEPSSVPWMEAVGRFDGMTAVDSATRRMPRPWPWPVCQGFTCRSVEVELPACPVA